MKVFRTDWTAGEFWRRRGIYMDAFIWGSKSRCGYSSQYIDCLELGTQLFAARCVVRIIIQP